MHSTSHIQLDYRCKTTIILLRKNLYDQHPVKTNKNEPFKKVNSAPAWTFSIIASANKLDVSMVDGNNFSCKHFLERVFALLCKCIGNWIFKKEIFEVEFYVTCLQISETLYLLFLHCTFQWHLLHKTFITIISSPDLTLHNHTFSPHPQAITSASNSFFIEILVAVMQWDFLLIIKLNLISILHYVHLWTETVKLVANEITTDCIFWLQDNKERACCSLCLCSGY